MDTILGILLDKSYSGIRALADLSMCVKYTNSDGHDGLDDGDPDMSSGNSARTVQRGAVARGQTR